MATPSYTPLYDADAVTLTRHSDADPTDWAPIDVAAWLNRIGLGAYSRAFEKNKIKGVQLKSLTEAHLTELGVLLVGDRLSLLTEVANLTATKETVLWSAEEVWSIHGPIDYLYKMHLRGCFKKLTCQRPAFWDQYKLTTNALIVTQRERGLLDDAVCCARAIKQTTRHIDLDHITGITTDTASKEGAMAKFDYGVADTINIELDRMKMLQPMLPMVIKQGESPAVVAMIMEQLAKKRAASPPKPSAMAR